MADLSITAANVVKGTGSSVTTGTAGASITAGQTVYLDSASGTYKLAKSNLAGAHPATGIALHASLSGQPLQVLTGGPINLGAVLTAGTAYYLSGASAGGICPVADLATGMTPVVLGIATSTSVLNVKIQDSGVTL